MEGKKGFQAGQPRPENAGRKKGSANKVTKQIKPLIAQFVGEQLEPDEIRNLWASLDAKDKAALLPKLINYVVPKQTSVEVDTNEVTPETAREILTALIEGQNTEDYETTDTKRSIKSSGH